MKHGLAAVALAALVTIIAGCAAPQPKTEEVFFPPPPSLPRYQYLAAFTGTRDIEEQSAFNIFVAGEAPKVGVDKPYGVAVYDGKIYVCDTNATVVIFDFNKEDLRADGGRGRTGQAPATHKYHHRQGRQQICHRYWPGTSRYF